MKLRCRVRGLLWRNALVLLALMGVFLFACIWTRAPAPRVLAMLVQRNLHTTSKTEGHGEERQDVHPFPPHQHATPRQTSPIHSSSLASIRQSLPDTIGEPVLDKDGIKIMPKAPVVPEGHALQISCVAKQLIQRQEQVAPYLTFQFPPMPSKYERRVSMTLRPGE